MDSLQHGALTSRQRIRIFLASPGDVTYERKLVRRTVERLRRDPFVKDRIDVELFGCDERYGGVPYYAEKIPQGSIGSVIRPSDCDIVVGILWSKMGTPFGVADLQAGLSKPPHKDVVTGTEW